MMPVFSGNNNVAGAGSWPMYRALVGVGIVCGLLIVSVFLVTLPVIERNEAAALDEAVFMVLPGAAKKTSYVLTQENKFRLAQEGDDKWRVVHAAYDRNGELAGIAIQAQGMGYQDTIRLLYGYAPRKQAIVGMRVLASKETPGLGDRIGKDAAFLENFEALDTSLSVDGKTLNNAIVAVKSGEKKSPWQIDGITGATVSSEAVASILRDSTQRWIPLVYSELASLAGEATDGQ